MSAELRLLIDPRDVWIQFVPETVACRLDGLVLLDATPVVGLDGSWAGAAAGGRDVCPVWISVPTNPCCFQRSWQELTGVWNCAGHCGPLRCLPWRNFWNWDGRDDCLAVLLVDDAGMALLVPLRDGEVSAADSGGYAVTAATASRLKTRSKVLLCLVTCAFCALSTCKGRNIIPTKPR